MGSAFCAFFVRFLPPPLLAPSLTFSPPVRADCSPPPTLCSPQVSAHRRLAPCSTVGMTV